MTQAFEKISSETTILIVDDRQENLCLLESILSNHTYHIRTALSGQLALSSIQTSLPDLLLLDIKMPGMSGYEVCERLKFDKRTRDIPVIFISALGEAADKIKGFSVGGIDYITKPFQKDDVLARIKIHVTLRRLYKQLEAQNLTLQQEARQREEAEKALQEAYDELGRRVGERTRDLLRVNEQLEREIEERRKAEQQLQEAFAEIARLKDRLEQENIYLREEIKLDHNFGEIIGQSDALAYPLYKVEKVAPTDTTVLLQGETGTGKELFARAIHYAGKRKNRPLIKVSCATLPAHLIESELFGHEKGAFTGAESKRLGRFELADGADLFLDEIGELPLELQPKLLRVLQEGEFERLGSSHTVKVDVRVIAATNRNLEQEVRQGRFRQDLYYRLKVYDITIPPLRRRKDDIPLLVQAFVRQLNKKLGKQIDTIPQHTMERLQYYPWPGNVRELENTVEQALINAHDNTLHVDLPLPQNESSPEGVPQSFESLSFGTLEELERSYISHILQQTNWKIAGDGGAAQVLGLNPSTLRSRIQKLGIQKPARQP
ncbi:MAG: response regulator [bacterium]|nr:response regulator [bacterium]